MGGTITRVSRGLRSRSIAAASLAAAQYLICVLALMWTGIVNHQPFFFADSTNYIRAADLAVHLASHRKLATVWTERYRVALKPLVNEPAPVARQAAPTGEAVHSPTANDLGAGLVMSGRSPYIGALMYIGWVIGWFWPFVWLQATIAYLLILWTLRRFALDRPMNVMATCLSLAATTSLPTYNSLLLADGFASFGILAFVLLALPYRWTWLQLAVLVAVLTMATIAHLTHLMMLIGMTVTLALLTATSIARPPRRIWIVALSTMAVAVLALQATSIATRVAIGRGPQLLPLVTARFYMDGPGKAFVEAGCDGGRFEVCHIPMGRPVNNAGWLFDTDPAVGAYMLASPDQRRRMGEQDVAFAFAVLRAYPLQQIAASARNTVRQLFWIDYDGLNQECGARRFCWESLPPVVRQRFDRSLSGRGEWPQALMNTILYVTVIIALVTLVVAMAMLARRDRPTFLEIREAVLIGGSAILVCSFFGGAVADPQYRYVGRLVWLPVLFAVVAALKAWRGAPGAGMMAAGRDDGRLPARAS